MLKEVISKILKAMGKEQDFLSSDRFYVELKTGYWEHDPLAIESWKNDDVREFSVRQYFIRNGDVVYNPDVQFRNDWVPVYMQLGSDYYENKDEIAEYLDGWAKRLLKEGFLEAASKTNAVPCEEEWGRFYGFYSYLDMVMESEVIVEHPSSENYWYITQLSDGRWIGWDEGYLRITDNIFSSREKAIKYLRKIFEEKAKSSEEYCWVAK